LVYMVFWEFNPKIFLYVNVILNILVLYVNGLVPIVIRLVNIIYELVFIVIGIYLGSGF
jgi:hypothetical protein